MSSLPLFDPRPGGAGDDHVTVSELTARLKEVIEGTFDEVGVVGEVSNLARPRSGHLYFSLKDAGASLRAVIWKSTASRLVFELADGLAVRVRGALTIYEMRGEYQLIARKIEPEGVGALELAFRQMFRRLEAEGLFLPDRKRPLPRYPGRIVIVASPTGAAVRDFLQITGRRWPATEILVAPSRVQGEGAAGEIARAIDVANQLADVDLIVLARGGGSLEDLWAFNTETVARAIAGSRLPVVSAVGHEIDVTIADFVADVRALTPSEAGERCVPDARELSATLEGLAGRLSRALRAEARHRRSRVDRLADRLARAVREPTREARARVEALSDRLPRAIAARIERRRADLAESVARLEALSPLAVLARGYSLTQHGDGDGPAGPTTLRDAASVRPGDLVRTRLARGSIVSRVERVEP
jgi:exodeoxyribonuclease VII large subunit